MYTTLLGGYEDLNEQWVARQSTIPFLCLTDDQNLQSETWQIRVVPPVFALDPVRSQREYKLRPHVHLAEFDFSIYIDNSVILSEPPERIFERYYPATGMCLPRHSGRTTVLDEFLQAAELGLDDQSRILEQLNHYALHCPQVLEQQPYWTAILLRDHRAPELCAMLDVWASHVMRYSRQDQLSANAVFVQSGLRPDVMDIDSNDSWFHSCPRNDSRVREKGVRSAAVSLSPPVARVKQLEDEVAKLERSLDDLLKSKAWRIGKALARWAGRHPRTVSLGYRGARALLRRGRAGKKTNRGGLAAVTARSRRSGASSAANATSTVYVDPLDRRGRELVASGGDLNPPTLLMWRRLVGSHRWTHVLDIGANYGEMLVGVDLPQGARVIAVEPNPRLIPYLQMTVSAGGVEADIVPCACSSHVGKASLVVDSDWSGKSELAALGDFDPDDSGDVVTVSTTTLDVLLGGPCVDRDIRALVKIDVEGHEMEVLKGGMEALARVGDFAALVEVLHANPQERLWMLNEFEVELLDHEKDTFVRVEPPCQERLDEMLADKRYYHQDVVLRPKKT